MIIQKPANFRSLNLCRRRDLLLTETQIFKMVEFVTDKKISRKSARGSGIWGSWFRRDPKLKKRRPFKNSGFVQIGTEIFTDQTHAWLSTFLKSTLTAKNPQLQTEDRVKKHSSRVRQNCNTKLKPQSLCEVLAISMWK